MTYPFVKAAHFSTGHKARKAIFVHMAEGGGTVEWLKNPDNPNVSAHYVVRYSGAIIQMVLERDSAWGINPSLLRTNNDSAFTFLGESIRYGVTAAKACLGAYWYDPNAAGITIEVEGFAKDGPNAAQRASLKRLVADIRTRHPKMPVLGHRDFQNYKACPGHKVAWVDFGGHAKAVASPTPTTTEDPVNSFTAFTKPYEVAVPTGAYLYDSSNVDVDADNIQVSPGRKMPYLGHFDANVGIVAYIPSSGVQTGTKAMFVKRAAVGTPTPVVMTVDDGYTKATQDAAVAAALSIQKAEDQKVIDEQAGVIASLRTDLAAAIVARDAALAAQVAAEAARDAAVALTAAANALKADMRAFLGL